MTVVDFDLTRSNATLYPDEVALVNTFRRLKNGLPTGYGDVHLRVEVVDQFGKFIDTAVGECAVVDPDAPTMVGAIYQLGSKPVSPRDRTNSQKLP